MRNEEVVLFICGAPHDRIGFEWATLHGGYLPITIAEKLDGLGGADRPSNEGGMLHIFRRMPDGVLYKAQKGINPSGDSSNRGAYIAVGCWLRESTGHIEDTARIFQEVLMIHEDLKVKRDPVSNKFDRDFDIRAYRHVSNMERGNPAWKEIALATTAYHMACEGTGSQACFTFDRFQRFPDQPIRKEKPAGTRPPPSRRPRQVVRHRRRPRARVMADEDQGWRGFIPKDRIEWLFLWVSLAVFVTFLILWVIDLASGDNEEAPQENTTYQAEDETSHPQ